MVDIPFDQLIELVDQLSSEEQIALVGHLSERIQQRELTAKEKIQLLRSVQVHVEV